MPLSDAQEERQMQVVSELLDLKKRYSTSSKMTQNELQDMSDTQKEQMAYALYNNELQVKKLDTLIEHILNKEE